VPNSIAGSNILRLPAVSARIGLKRDAIYKLVREKKLAPPIKLTSRASGWLESDVAAFIEHRASARGKVARISARPLSKDQQS
jgi:prophage regulatory protein